MSDAPDTTAEPAPVIVASADRAADLPTHRRDDDTLVIDLLSLGRADTSCADGEPDPFNPEIVVCRNSPLSPRIGPDVLPEVDDFGNAIPRAQVRFSDKASAEANAIHQGVGGFNASGGEVRLKIDF